jgi:hypothetical protein
LVWPPGLEFLFGGLEKGEHGRVFVGRDSCSVEVDGCVGRRGAER